MMGSRCEVWGCRADARFVCRNGFKLCASHAVHNHSGARVEIVRLPRETRS